MNIKSLAMLFILLFFMNGCFSSIASSAEDALFLELCKTGASSDVALAIKSGANVNVKDETGATCLMLAAKYNEDPGVVTILIKNGARLSTEEVNESVDLFGALVESPQMAEALVASGANPNILNEYGTPFLFDVIYLAGNAVNWDEINELNALLNTLNTLIDYNVDVNAIKEDEGNGKSALMYAMQNNANYDIVRMLLDSGANVHATDNDGLTALMYAAFANDSSEVFQALLEAGADVRATDKNGITALTYAARNANSEIMKMLLERGANVHEKGSDGSTALIMAACFNNNPDVIELMLENGARVNDVDHLGRTALMMASGFGNPDMVSTLLEHGAKANMFDKEGRTALTFATLYNNRPKIYSLLLNARPSLIHARDRTGLTALALAVENNKPEAFMTLLEFKSDVNARDNNGWTPLMKAARNLTLLYQEEEIQQVSLAPHPRFYSYFRREKIASESFIFALLQNGAALEARARDGRTALLITLQHNPVARTGDGKRAPLVFFQQSIPTIVTKELLSDYVVIEADSGRVIDRGDEVNPAVVLLAGGGNPNAADNEGKTALMTAIRHNVDLALVESLLEHGAEINAKDKNGRTALMYAALFTNFPEVVSMLIDHGADITAKDNDGKIADDFALFNKNLPTEIRLSLRPSTTAVIRSYR